VDKDKRRTQLDKRSVNTFNQAQPFEVLHDMGVIFPGASAILKSRSHTDDKPTALRCTLHSTMTEMWQSTNVKTCVKHYTYFVFTLHNRLDGHIASTVPRRWRSSVV